MNAFGVEDTRVSKGSVSQGLKMVNNAGKVTSRSSMTGGGPRMGPGVLGRLKKPKGSGVVAGGPSNAFRVSPRKIVDNTSAETS